MSHVTVYYTCVKYKTRQTEDISWTDTTGNKGQQQSTYIVTCPECGERQTVPIRGT